MNLWQALDLINRRLPDRNITVNFDFAGMEVQILRDRRGLYSATDCHTGDQLVPPTDEATLVDWLVKLRKS